VENVDVAISKVLRRLRESKDLSQEELSFKSNLHRTYISQLERSQKSVTVKSLLKITSALETPIDQFLKDVVDELGRL
jgi:transcriptional regulator with XRE-family HTH domain